MPTPFENEDDLGTYAGQAGIPGFEEFVAQSGGVDPGFDAALEESVIDMGPQEPPHYEFTPEESAGLLPQAPEAPGVPQGDVSPVGPAGVPPQDIAVSGKGSGYSESQARKIDKRDVGLARDIQAADQTARSNFDPAFQALSNAKVTQQAAEKAMTEAKVGKIGGEALAAVHLSDINQKFALAEEEINAHYTSKQNQAQLDYVAALQDFRASRVDPGQLWGKLGGGERFGFLVSAFLHDFLGSRGIKTSAMTTLNAAIDRNIAAQEYAIKTKGQAAEGFKQIWEMQRQQSASDAEARQRVRGFMLESVKQATLANMAQYEAGLATAQGKQAMAKIDEAQAQNLVEIYKEIGKNTHQLRGQAISWNATKLQEANASWANSLRAKELAFQKEKYDEAKKTTPRYLFNEETNRGEVKFKDNISEAEKAKVTEKWVAIQNINSTLTDIRTLARSSTTKVNDLLKGTRLSTQDQRLYDALTVTLAHQMAQATDGRVTDKDVKDFLRTLPQDTDLTRGGIDKILAYTHVNAIKPIRGLVREYTDDVPLELQPEGAKNIPLQGSFIDADASKNRPVETPEDISKQYITTPAANLPADEAQRDRAIELGVKQPSEDWKAFRKSIKAPEAKKGDSLGAAIDRKIVNTPPSYAVGLMILGKQAKQDAKSRKELFDYAYPELEGPTAVLPDGTDANSTEGKARSNLAQWLLIQKDE